MINCLQEQESTEKSLDEKVYSIILLKCFNSRVDYLTYYLNILGYFDIDVGSPW